MYNIFCYKTWLVNTNNRFFSSERTAAANDISYSFYKLLKNILSYYKIEQNKFLVYLSYEI